MIIVVSSPSASGKTTLVNYVASVLPIKKVITTTTRPKRLEERGDEYHFVNSEEFEAIASVHGFIETENVYGNQYGLQYNDIDESCDNIVILDVKGARKMRHIYGDRVKTIFIYPPSFDVIEERINNRHVENAIEKNERLMNVHDEVNCAHEFDHVVCVDSLDKMMRKMLELVSMICG